jgi:hypothetical protein
MSPGGVKRGVRATVAGTGSGGIRADGTRAGVPALCVVGREA